MIFRTGIRISIVLLLIASLSSVGSAQKLAEKFKARHQDYFDSLKTMDYDYLFPILGDRVYKKGIDIPLPFGIMVNNFYGTQGIEISNMRLGVITSDTTLGPADLSNVIKFESVDANILNLNIRADLYVLPFLDVYALFGYAPYVQTKVVLGEPISLTSEPKQTGFNYGLGVMAAGAVGPIWVSGDYNITWSNMQLLESRVLTQLLGFRMGHAFRLKDPKKNISVWIGAMGIFLNSGTKGQIALNDALDDIDQAKIDEIKDSYNDWYNDLGRVEQEVVDAIMEGLQDRVDGNLRDLTVTYEMDKTPSVKFAGLVGAQYQFNKNWQLRVESNCISAGHRYSVLASINYRFPGLKKKSKTTPE